MKHLPAYLTLLFTVTFVISPALTSPFSGFEADQLPIPQIDPPVQPAGYTFSIWGLIYAWLVVSAAYGVWARRDNPAWDHARWPLIGSLAIGTPWLAIANTSAIWASITIALMAILAIWSLLRAPAADRWWLQAPVAIYAGWLTAATFVSLGSTSAGYGILLDSLNWAYAAIVLALIVAIVVLRRKPQAPEYGVTIIWALIGIIVANTTQNIGVTLLALAGIAIVALQTWSGAQKT